MTQLELKKFLQGIEGYKNFKILDVPTPFNVLFSGKPIDVVQLHSITPCKNDKSICGFCGKCRWVGDTLTPLDSDSYSSTMTVYGYRWFTRKGLDILVGADR